MPFPPTDAGRNEYARPVEVVAHAAAPLVDPRVAGDESRTLPALPLDAATDARRAGRRLPTVPFNREAR